MKEMEKICEKKKVPNEIPIAHDGGISAEEMVIRAMWKGCGEDRDLLLSIIDRLRKKNEELDNAKEIKDGT